MTIEEIIDDSLHLIAYDRWNCIGDYAPLHYTLAYLTAALRAHGRSFNDNRGWAKVMLRLLQEAKGTQGRAGRPDLLENDPWLPCHVCGAEHEPELDIKLVKSFIRTERRGFQHIDFYRCNECGGDTTVLCVRGDGEPRHNELPWEHEEYKYDLLFEDE